MIEAYVKTAFCCLLFFCASNYCKATVTLYEYKVGVLTYPDSLSLFELAKERAEKEGVLHGINVSYLVRPTTCKLDKGIFDIIDMYKNYHVDAVIGPTCSRVCKPAGKYMAVWNLPWFAGGCTDNALNDKTMYSSLVRLMPSIVNVGQVFVELFKYYGWKRAALIIEEGSTCILGANRIQHEFKLHDFTISEFIPAAKELTTEGADRILMQIRERSRISIICMATLSRNRLLHRARLNRMTQGEYVFIYYSWTAKPDTYEPWRTVLPEHKENSDEQNVESRKAFHSYLQVTGADISRQDFEVYSKLVLERDRLPPYSRNDDDDEPSTFGPYAFDASYLLLRTVNKSLEAGMDPKNGSATLETAKLTNFRGWSGDVVIDHNGDRIPNYWVFDYGPGMSEFTPVLYLDMSKPTGERLSVIGAPFWGVGITRPPLDTPVCGYHGELCIKLSSYMKLVIALSTTALIVMCGTITVQAYRSRRSEMLIQQMVWRVKYGDICFLSDQGNSNLQILHGPDDVQHSVKARSAIFQGLKVMVDILPKAQEAVLSRQSLVLLKEMKRLRHNNVTQFIGACIDPPNVCVLTANCARGSLKSVLRNENINLNESMTMSLITDMMNGLTFIYKFIRADGHGFLTSHNCYIDNQWFLKIYAQCPIHLSKNLVSPSELVWSAPELLREWLGDSRTFFYDLSSASKEGDIYSFAIILQEILSRNEPYFMTDNNVEDLLDKIIHPSNGQQPFRPSANLIDVSSKSLKQMKSLMIDCWAEDPKDRPNVGSIQTTIKEAYRGRKMNVLDNMVEVLENYALNLEHVVEQRTRDIIEEKKKAENVLHSILPRSVANKLMNGQKCEAEMFDSVTIYFSDIAGFTSLSAASTTIQVITLLNDLYTVFDAVIRKHDVYKVETIGDAYMVVSGLPQRNGNRHVMEVANTALELLHHIKEFKVQHKPSVQLKLRIGLHTGPCAAGVVGQIMPRYCLFGETVTIASLMESTGEAMKIQLSAQCYETLSNFPSYCTEERGKIRFESTGELLTTYWLNGKHSHDSLLI